MKPPQTLHRDSIKTIDTEDRHASDATIYRIAQGHTHMTATLLL